MTTEALLQTEVQYVTDAGDPVITSLRLLDGDRALHGLPVRKIRSHKGQTHYPGFFWSDTTGRHVEYESRMELDRMWLADFDRDVHWIAAQPLWLCGRDGEALRRHAPDLLLGTRSGGFTLVDVKPEAFARRPEVRAVFDWTARLCDAKGWRYEVWTGADPVHLANVRWLGGARRRDLIDEAALAAVLARPHAASTIAQLCEAASREADPSLVRRVVMFLLWSHVLQADLTQVLEAASAVAWREDAA